MCDGFSAYKYYMALKLHFGSDKYNVFENKGKVKCSRETFAKRNDFYMFEKLARRFSTDQELIQFMASNFIYKNANVIYSGSEADDNFIEWKRRKQSATKLFSDDCDKLISLHKPENEIFYCTLNTLPYIINLYIANKINIETIRILDDTLDFISKWTDNSILLLLDDDIRRIKKSKGFVKYDKVKVLPIFNNLKEELKLNDHGQHV